MRTICLKPLVRLCRLFGLCGKARIYRAKAGILRGSANSIFTIRAGRDPNHAASPGTTRPVRQRDRALGAAGVPAGLLVVSRPHACRSADRGGGADSAGNIAAGVDASTPSAAGPAAAQSFGPGSA